jgi:carbamoyl-phosphate synthase large subunit
VFPVCPIAVADDDGLGLALLSDMGVSRLEDLVAWQLAHAFKVEIYALIDRTPRVANDPHFRNQLRDAAASVGMNIGEGFHRFGAREFRRFLSIAIASLAEATLWLRDGIDRRHFDESACQTAFNLSKRCRVAAIRLHQSLGAPRTPGTPRSSPPRT